MVQNKRKNRLRETLLNATFSQQTKIQLMCVPCPPMDITVDTCFFLGMTMPLAVTVCTYISSVHSPWSVRSDLCMGGPSNFYWNRSVFSHMRHTRHPVVKTKHCRLYTMLLKLSLSSFSTHIYTMCSEYASKGMDNNNNKKK